MEFLTRFLTSAWTLNGLALVFTHPAGNAFYFRRSNGGRHDLVISQYIEVRFLPAIHGLRPIFRIPPSPGSVYGLWIRIAIVLKLLGYPPTRGFDIDPFSVFQATFFHSL